MEEVKIKIDILPNQYLNSDGTFNIEEAISLCGKIAGVCYDKEGFSHLSNEPIEKTKRRRRTHYRNITITTDVFFRDSGCPYEAS